MKGHSRARDYIIEDKPLESMPNKNLNGFISATTVSTQTLAVLAKSSVSSSQSQASQLSSINVLRSSGRTPNVGSSLSEESTSWRAGEPAAVAKQSTTAVSVTSNGLVVTTVAARQKAARASGTTLLTDRSEKVAKKELVAKPTVAKVTKKAIATTSPTKSKTASTAVPPAPSPKFGTKVLSKISLKPSATAGNQTAKATTNAPGQVTLAQKTNDDDEEEDEISIV